MKNRLLFINQWHATPGSRDITWFGVEHSSFKLPYVEWSNVHMYILGFGIIWWYKGLSYES